MTDGGKYSGGKLWITDNLVKLNEDKTKFMILKDKHNLAKVQYRKTTVCNEEMLLSATSWGENKIVNCVSSYFMFTFVREHGLRW